MIPNASKHSTEIVESFKETFDKLIIFILYGTAVIVPLAIYPYTLDQALAIKYLILKISALILGGLLLSRVVVAGYKVGVSDLELPVGLLLTLLIIATIFSVHMPTSIAGAFLRYDGLISYLIYFMLFFVSVQYLSDEGRREKLLSLGILTAVVISIYGIAQRFGVDPVPWGYVTFDIERSFATLGNPVMLGGYLSLMVPIAAGMSLGAALPAQRRAYLVATIMISLAAVASMSRGAWIGILAGILVMGVLIAQRRSVNVRAAVAPIAAAVVVVALAIALIGVPVLSERAISIGSLEGSVGTRLSMWRSAASMIADRPLFGFGPDTLSLTFSRYEESSLARITPLNIQDNVHNAFLQLAATVGVPALLVFLFIIGLLLMKAIAHVREQAEIPYITVGLIGGVVAYSVQSATGITGIATSTFLWLGMGTLAATWSEERIELRPLSGIVRDIAIAAIAVVVIANLPGAIRPFMSDTALAKARIAEKSGDIVRAQEFYEEAIALNQDDDKARRELGIMLADAGGRYKDFRVWSDGIAYLDEAAWLSPRNQLNQMLLGQGYLYGARAFDRKYFASAERHLKDAIELRPYSAAARTMLAVALLEAGRLGEAQANLAIALDINPGDPQAHYYMGRYYEEIGQKKDALNEYKTAVNLDGAHQKARSAYERLIHGSN